MLKKFITILTIVALLCSVMSLGFTATASYTDETVYGDVNGDGVVDTEDARVALKIAAGLHVLDSEDQLIRTDVNFDGLVTSLDARQILRGAAGLATLQPSGAFNGFDGGGVFTDEESLVTLFNAYLNKIKVVENEEKQYIAATITKTESDNLTSLNIKEVELPILGNGSAEGVADMVEESLTEDDKENESIVIPFGSTDFTLVSVEGENYVSNLSASDVFGSKASYDAELGQLTIEIALPDTEVEMSPQSAYAKVLNTNDMIAEQNTTLMKLMKASSGETAMLREFKNCVLTIVVDVATNNVLSYIVSYQSKVYVAQTNFGIGSLSAAKLKGVEFEKDHLIKYEDFQWPSK
jgi:hypothetical protein